MNSHPTQVILADDHDLIRAGIRNALKDIASLNIISEVGTGEELKQALASLSADLLLMDVNMPGFEALKEIHNIRQQYPKLHILIVSAYDDDVYVQGLLSAGANGYHLKDQPLSELRLAIERILSGKRWVSSPLVDKLLSPSPKQVAIPSLSKRQQDIARCLTNGLSNREIAEQLHLSIKTVENHLTRLYNQLHVANRLEALSFIHEHPELLALPGQTAVTTAFTKSEPIIKTKTNILIVDDNKRYRKQLSRLVGAAYSNSMIFEAGNVEESIHIALKVNPDIIFMDVVLGNEDGISCTKRLKRQMPNARIVLISAYPDREFHRRGLEAGATAFIDKKDLDTTSLQQIIEDVI